MIQALCGNCGRDLQTVNSARTKFLKCPRCGTSFILKSLPIARPTVSRIADADDESDLPESSQRALQFTSASRELDTTEPLSYPMVIAGEVDGPEPVVRRTRPLMSFLAFSAAVITTSAVVCAAVLVPFGGEKKSPPVELVAQAPSAVPVPLPLPPEPRDEELDPTPRGERSEAARAEEAKRPGSETPLARPSLPEIDMPRPKERPVAQAPAVVPGPPPASPKAPATEPAPSGPTTPAADPAPSRPAPRKVTRQEEEDDPAPPKPARKAETPPVAAPRQQKVDYAAEEPANPAAGEPGHSGEAPSGPATFKLPPAGGAVMLNDGKTLVVSATSQATLIYIDTVANKELQRVEVDFAPTALAVLGNQLIASAKGSSSVHVLAAATGKLIRTIKLEGEPIKALACNPHRGYVYGTNTADEVIAINSVAGTSKKTAARGQMIAVGAGDRKYVYTGIQKPIRDTLVFREQGNQVHVSSRRTGINGGLLQFEVQGDDLVPVTLNDNAADNGRYIGVSADGKLAAMAGGGGWKSKNDPKRNYCIAIFDTSDMKTMVGQVETDPFPAAIAFHPTINLGAAFNTTVVSVFSTKSFTKKDTFKVQQAGAALFLGFAANGTKVVYCPEGGTNCVTQVWPITLSDKDKDALKSADAR